MTDVQLSIERNNLKLSATKIMQGLKKVRNEPSKSRRRWIWELVQNAKDILNRFGRVRIRVELDEQHLRFSHNGDAFTIDDITGLIQQVSTKDSGGNDKEVTGKFGTGFISTHLLSERVAVEGVTIRPDGRAKHFNLVLDRRGRTAEELTPHLESTLERITRIDEDPDYTEIPGYEAKRKVDDLDTTLTYHFQGKQGLSAAQVGLDDLRNTLPFTLANVPKIESVQVVDRIQGNEVHFICGVEQLATQVRSMKVTIAKAGALEDVHFLCWDSPGITLMVELSDPDTKALKPNFGEHETLYRQFPLIGSQKFYWPFMVNGDAFFPNEDRDGLLLGSEEDEDSLANRALLEKAVEEAIAFGEWLIDYGAINRYVMAYTRIPDIPWEDEAREWYRALQTNWRKRLVELPLLESAAGAPALLRDSFIPKYGATKEVREAFWGWCVPFYGRDVVPRKDLLHAWLTAIGPEAEDATWGKELQLCFDLKDMFGSIAERGHLAGLELDSDERGGPTDPSVWLHGILGFAMKQNEVELLSEYAVVPNHLGKLHKLGELHEEDPESPIPDEVLDILERLGEDWRSKLIHRDIRLEGLRHQKRGLREASATVTELLGMKELHGGSRKRSSFLDTDDAVSILFELLSMIPPGSRDSFQQKLFTSAQAFFRHDSTLREVKGIAEFNFTQPLRLMIEAMHFRLSELDSIGELANFIVLAEDKATNWIDDHLRLLDSSEEFKAFLEVGNIVPNRNGQFRGYTELYNYGTDETPLDEVLLDVLAKLDPDQDWREELISDGIGIKLPNTRSMAELGVAVQKEVFAIKAEPAALNEQSEPLLTLIDWCEQNEQVARTHLSSFLDHKNSLFFDLVAKNRIGTGIIRMLTSESYVNILRTIHDSGLDAEEVDKLMQLGAELGSLDAIIDRAAELVEERRDFEYKKELGKAIETAFMEALRATGVDAVIHYIGKGSHDVEVVGRLTAKIFRIEIKSISVGSSDPLKLAGSQVNALVHDPLSRALCVLERTVDASEVTPEHIRQHLKYKVSVEALLLNGLEAHGSLQKLLDNPQLDVQLLGEPRIKLDRNKFMTGASGFDALVEAIKRAIA